MSPLRQKGIRLGSISARATAPLLTAVVVASAAVWFLLTTVLTGFTSDAAIVGCAGVLACGFAVVSGSPALRVLHHTAPAATGQALIAGVLMLFVAPALVLANRFSDAPPGSEVLFFTAASWALLAVIAAVCLAPASRRDPAWPSAVAYACMALVGCALILANWERPSSFSPFMRYWREEIYMLIAGLAWAVGCFMYARAREALGEHSARGLAFMAGGVAAAGFWWVNALVGSGAVGDWGTLAAAGIAFVVFTGAWFALTSRAGTLRAPFTLYLVPVVMTLLGVVEQRVNPRGPDPVVWPGALSGITLVLLASAAAVALGRHRDAVPKASTSATPVPFSHPASDPLAPLAPTAALPRAAQLATRPPAARIAAVIGAAVAIAAAASLALPAMNAEVLGRLSLGKPYAAKWVMMGYETAAGWLPVSSGLLVLAAAWALRARARVRDVVAPAALALAVLGLYPTNASTPLHTWNTWLPSSLQVEFGTEYVALTFDVIHHPVRLAIMGLTALAAVFLLLVAVSSRRTSSVGTTSEVSR